MGSGREVTVDGLVQYGQTMLWCRACGPLGVSQTHVDATSAVLIHLNWHNCDTTQIRIREKE